MGVSDGGGLAVEELPPGALQAVTNCLQWLLLLEIWRHEALKVHQVLFYLYNKCPQKASYFIFIGTSNY